MADQGMSGGDGTAKWFEWISVVFGVSVVRNNNGRKKHDYVVFCEDVSKRNAVLPVP